MQIASFFFSLLILFTVGFSNSSIDYKPSTTEKVAQIEWLTYEEAVAKSKIEPRKILVDVYTDWCGFCKTMDKVTFGEQTIAKYVNKRFYAVKLNAEMKEPIQANGKIYEYVDHGKGGYHELAIALTKGDLSFPTIVVLNEELKISKIMPGFKKPKEMDKILRYYGENHYKTTPFNLFAKTYRSRVK